MRVLIVRPEPGASATAEHARALGFDPVRVPLFAVEPVAWEAPDPAAHDAVAFTSANAARHAGNALSRYTHLPAYAVGEATARAAQAAHFATVVAGPSNAAALQAVIPPCTRLLHFAGRGAHDLGGEMVTVYQSREVEIDETGRAAIDASALALVHSPRAGARLAALHRRPATAHVVAISQAAARACGTGWASLSVARAPTDAAILALAARLCDMRAAVTGDPDAR